jgi:hypothetical protein
MYGIQQWDERVAWHRGAGAEVETTHVRICYRPSHVQCDLNSIEATRCCFAFDLLSRKDSNFFSLPNCLPFNLVG